MRTEAPFQPDDLTALDQLLYSAAAAVVPMGEIADGNTDPNVIGLRHDVDNVIEPAVAMAEWEAARGYRSTYYILHTAPYWRNKTLLRDSLDRIASAGHEIGIHNNALAEAAGTGRNPVTILSDAVAELRTFGHPIRGTVAHGDPRCYNGTKVAFVNDELFVECARGIGYRGRVSLRELGLDYDANWLSRGFYMSDSGGRWSSPGFDEVAARFPANGQLHVLVHPDWWGEAFSPRQAAA